MVKVFQTHQGQKIKKPNYKKALKRQKKRFEEQLADKQEVLDAYKSFARGEASAFEKQLSKLKKQVEGKAKKYDQARHSWESAIESAKRIGARLRGVAAEREQLVVEILHRAAQLKALDGKAEGLLIRLEGYEQKIRKRVG